MLVELQSSVVQFDAGACADLLADPLAHEVAVQIGEQPAGEAGTEQ